MARSRLYLDLSEAEKERFQKTATALGSNITAVICEFLPQWCEQQEKANSILPRIFVICLNEELYRRVSDKIGHTTIDQVVIGWLENWVEEDA